MASISSYMASLFRTYGDSTTEHASMPAISSVKPACRCVPELSVVVPTLNERENIGPLIDKIRASLGGLSWELIFVDDDSSDGTADTVRAQHRADGRIGLIHRTGRRGLSSACIAGMRATTAPFIAIMDADLQHDESILPRMLCLLRAGNTDVVIGTRHAHGGSMGNFNPFRVLLSRIGKAVSRLVFHAPLSDPMSGFFIVRRSFFAEVQEKLDGRGFKILLDMLVSCRRPVAFAEVGYRFRNRQRGESKLNARILFDYLLMIGRRRSRRIVAQRSACFATTSR